MKMGTGQCDIKKNNKNNSRHEREYHMLKPQQFKISHRKFLPLRRLIFIAVYRKISGPLLVLK
ncbi:MAG: hypothetical protein QGI64_00315, partial [Desulfobacterales bacterium]|nr:hypothetical protein [Desulfobacterales bacterium]